MKQLLIVLLLPLFGLSQKIDFSGYKYVYINPLNHQGVDEQYGLTTSIASSFTAKGLVVANSLGNNIPQDLKSNPCLMLTATPFYSEGTFSAKIKVDIVNCNNEKLFSKEVSGTAMLTEAEAYAKVIKRIAKEIENITYSFNPTLTPEYKVQIDQSYKMPNTGLSEDSIRKYLDKNALDPIEGIYKSFRQSDDTSPSYKLGIIKKSPGQYLAIILESESIVWKEGEVKAIFESTAMSDIFSIKYFMQDKSKVETFASISKSIIKVDFSNAQSKENSSSTFIKTYPFTNSKSSGEITIGGSNEKMISSGTGFLVSENGYIITNYHVIEGGNRFTASNSENSKNYELEIIQKDKLNDIAILKIKKLEEKFQPLPYKLSSKAKVGQNIFTIGYPLNDVMGDNHKVTNGIISSLTGTQDDSRYFQISAPIQPGNSGGPLFDMKGSLIGITTATLNPEAVKTNVQNVNYAIKISSLQNLLTLMPDDEQFQISNFEGTVELPLSMLVEKYKSYVFKIQTYK